MYGIEAWKLTKTETKKLDAFPYKCMKRILRIRWPHGPSHTNDSRGLQELTEQVTRSGAEDRIRSDTENREEH